MNNAIVNICSDVDDFRNKVGGGNKLFKVHSVERTRGQTIECSLESARRGNENFLNEPFASSNGTTRQENTAR